QPPNERDPNLMFTCLHGHTDLQTVIGRVHVNLEFGISLRVAGETLGHGHAFGFTSNREALEECTIQTNIDSLWLAHTHDVVIFLPSQTNFDCVFGVEGKMIANGSD